jgi:CubicO group peptidase (beta-lactamase class C family)
MPGCIVRTLFRSVSHRLLAGSLLFLCAAPQLQAQSRADALDGFIAAYAKQHDFNGTVRVQQDGKRRYERSFGLSDFQHGVANNDQTRYWIASITKLFTAALVLQLQEQGKLDLQATVATYLPDYAVDGADRITVHQLLNHTSGLKNFDQVKSLEQALTEGLPTYQAPYTSEQLIRKFGSGPLEHAPGTSFDYNNGDYLLLGKIIERIAGKTYEQVLRERILAPLGMRDTGMLRHADVVKGLASTYSYRDDLKALSNDFPVYPENWYAAGAMYSTVDDVLRFSDALFGSRLLHKATLALLTTPGLDDYGYGLWVYETRIGKDKHRVAKRPGRIMGAQAQLYRFLDRDLTVVILANTANTDLDEFVAQIGKAAIGPNTQ